MALRCDRTVDRDIVKQIGLGDLRCVGRFSHHPNTVWVAYGQAHRSATPTKQRY
jgi:hypothetical protein